MIVIILVGTTAAFFIWTSEEEEIESSVDVTIANGSGRCEKASDNEKLLAPSSNRNGGRIVTIEVSQEMAPNAQVVLELNVNKLNNAGEVQGLKHNSFKYEMVNTTSNKSYGSGNFSTISEGDKIKFQNASDILVSGNTYTFTLYLWIDGTIGENPIEMTEQPYDFDIFCNITGTD